ncbi:MAG: SDR family NAD(P)-dependent oxidoreductase, partial [Clostridia bacterium]|nr:SDR family NAD(P)-dependent oxidoreductase [Clostridia bacterium]
MNKFVINKNVAISAAADFVAIILGFLFAILLVGSVGPAGTLPEYFTWFPLTAIIAAIFEFGLFFLLKMFESEWKPLNIANIIKLSAATVIAFVLTYLLAFICGFDIAVSAYIVSLVLTLCFMICARYVLSVISGQTSFSISARTDESAEDGDEEKEPTSYFIPDEEIENLIGEEPVNPMIEKVISVIAGKKVLVTGGAGTVGRELCRQIAAYSPKLLVVLDINESSASSLGRSLTSKFPKLSLEVVVGNICDSEKIDAIFEKYRPEIVFHAAAYNQTELMEANPDEAIKNNVFGTLNTAQAADKFGVERFMLLSTEKAVRPISMVGVSKQLCESVIRLYSSHSKTNFAAVR